MKLCMIFGYVMHSVFVSQSRVGFDLVPCLRILRKGVQLGETTRLSRKTRHPKADPEQVLTG